MNMRPAPLVASLGLLAAPLAAERLNVLEQGRYICAVPGDAAGDALRVQHGKEFRIIGTSSYEHSEGSGTYLRTGNNVVFTRGPMKGMRFVLQGMATLRLLDDQGERAPLRCIRRVR